MKRAHPSMDSVPNGDDGEDAVHDQPPPEIPATNGPRVHFNPEVRVITYPRLILMNPFTVHICEPPMKEGDYLKARVGHEEGDNSGQFEVYKRMHGHVTEHTQAIHD